MKSVSNDFKNLVKELKLIISKARHNIMYTVNKEMLKTYFEIGRRIVEEEQKGEKRAGYGKHLIETLSYELTHEFGKGFSTTGLRDMRTFYDTYKIRQTLSGELFKLSWSHYCEFIKIKDTSKRDYFEKYAVSENLSVRDLKRQIYSLHYERLLMSKNKKDLIAYERKGNIPQKPEDVIKDPYVLEFLDLSEKHMYTEKDIETKIIGDLQKFLLELGQGFSFVARQKRFTIDNDHYYIDLLFYNIYLKCYVVIEVKTTKFKHSDIGQLNFYLNYVHKKLNKKEDHAPIGILLCTEKNEIQVEFATSGLLNKMFVSQYLPSKKQLENEVRKLL